MNERVHYTYCPVCGSGDIKNVLSVKDHAVSGETFPVAECGSCSLRFTQDVPGAEYIAPYYKSVDYISHTDKSKGLIGILYKKVRNRTLIRKRKLIEQETGCKKCNLLDIGSGTGAFINEMIRQGWQATGIEPDDGARSLAKKLYGIDMENEGRFYQLPADSFDVITLWHVLEHIHDLAGYVQRLKLLLKKNGKLFIAVPNYTSLDARIFKEFWAAYDVPKHLYHFSPRSMQRLIEINGMKIIRYLPMWYDSFYISLLSSRYKTGKSRWIASLCNGLRSNINAWGKATNCSSIIYVISN
ncbi:MAG: class I SAM-dependent methyltransferase [Chitinophagaceae bacterium]|jgi:2-polyprenyl-3-methyl-5-hydroxy-6-metoxy-1,4-benzoquinol methylase|nr:class I SAM-dependent methyltransferase [Chitinophagaceae bacterium]OQY94339.1 MAG: methyltransferase type 12 [Sphingobacteriales bacterium UTBCD1]